jgi:hypothetical protein
MIFHKDKLLEMGGVRPDPIHKWARLTAPGEPVTAKPHGASPARETTAGGTR